MKKYILLALISVMAFSSKAQVIDTSFHHGVAVGIVPFKVKFNDVNNVTHLQVQVTYDDLDSNASVYWKLVDTTGSVHLDGNSALSKTAYASWKSDHTEPFKFIAALLSLTFKND